MAQITAGDGTIDPTVVDGTDLAARLERFYSAEASQNSGPSRPANLQAGGIWCKTGAANSPELYMYDGTTDVLIMNKNGISTDLQTITDSGNTTTNAITVAGFTSTGIDDNATSTAITIDSSQNVGIGDVSPSKRLSVREDTTGTYSASGASEPPHQARINNLDTTTANTTAMLGFAARGTATTTSAWFIGNVGMNNAYADSSFVFQNRTGGSSWAERMRIDSSGNVGIGTISPLGKLDIRTSGSGTLLFLSNGAASAEITSTATEFAFGTGTKTPLAFKTNSTERMRIDATGDVKMLGNAFINGTTAVTSDANVKSNIADVPVDLSVFSNIKAKTYMMDGKQRTGILAQDLEAHFPNAVITVPVEDEDANTDAWSSSTDYTEGQVVKHKGKVYKALSDVQTGVQPDEVWTPATDDTPAAGGWEPVRDVWTRPVGTDGNPMMERKYLDMGAVQGIMMGAISAAAEKIEALEARLTALEGK